MVYTVHTHGKSASPRRALLLSGALLACSTAVAAYTSSHALGSRFTPPGWSISMQIPTGFRRLDTGADSNHATVELELVVSEKTLAKVVILRHDIGPQDSVEDIALAVCQRQFHGLALLGTLSDVHAAGVGPFDGAEVRLLDHTGYPIAIIRAVVVGQIEAYSFTLLVAGEPNLAYRRFDALTRTVRPG